jgi:hypothetical protein
MDIYLSFQPGEGCRSYRIIIHGFKFSKPIRNSRIVNYNNEIVCLDKFKIFSDIFSDGFSDASVMILIGSSNSLFFLLSFLPGFLPGFFYSFPQILFHSEWEKSLIGMKRVTM